MMKLVKKYKFTIIVLLLFVLSMFGVYQIKEWFFPNEGKAIYGERLVGKVEVEKQTYDQVKATLKEKEKVESAEVRESGRLINITVVVQTDTSLDEAKALPNGILDLFTDSQKGYYDFQIFVEKEDKAENNFPIIGYKHHNNTDFVWSKDREKTDISNQECKK